MSCHLRVNCFLYSNEESGLPNVQVTSEKNSTGGVTHTLPVLL